MTTKLTFPIVAEALRKYGERTSPEAAQALLEKVGEASSVNKLSGRRFEAVMAAIENAGTDNQPPMTEREAAGWKKTAANKKRFHAAYGSGVKQ